MRSPMNMKQHTQTNLAVTCVALLFGLFALLTTPIAHAGDQEAAVATADATTEDAVDSIIDHSINMQGLKEAKSATQTDGTIVLDRDQPTIQVAKKPEEKIIPKKPELVEIKPPMNALMMLPVISEIK